MDTEFIFDDFKHFRRNNFRFKVDELHIRLFPEFNGKGLGDTVEGAV